MEKKKNSFSEQPQNKHVQTRLSRSFALRELRYDKCLWRGALEITWQSSSMEMVNDDRIKDAAKASFMVFPDSDAPSPLCCNFSFQATCAAELRARLQPPPPRTPPHHRVKD